MTSAQVVETSVNVTSNSPSQDYTHPDDHNLPNYDMTPGFKPFTVLSKNYPHLTEFKALFTAFSLSFMRFTLSIYICCLELLASQDFPCTSIFNKFNKYSTHHCQKSPESFPLLSSPESTVTEVFLVSAVHVSF